MAEIGVITARLRADVSQFNTGIQQAQGQLRGLGTSATGAQHGLREVRTGLVALATESLGVSGPLARVSQGLLMFGAGSTVVLAVAAGLAIIGKAIEETGKASKEAAAQHKAQAKALQDLITANTPAAQQNLATLAATRGRIAELGAELTGLLAQQPFAEKMWPSGALEKLRTKIGDLRAEIAKLENQLRLAAGAAVRMEAVVIEATGALPPGGNRNVVMGGTVTGRGNVTPGMQGAQSDALTAGMANSNFGIFGVGRNPKLQSDLAKQMKELGVSAIAAFVAGLAAGTASFGDLLKSIFTAFLTAGITKVFNILFKIGSPSGWAKDMGGYLAEGLALGIESGTGRVGGASLRLASAVPSGFVGAARININPSLPPSRSPFDVARDADWLRALGESARELGYRGFKFK